MSARGYRVALRADASRQIGLGHVKRCLALAQALRRIGIDTCVVSRALGARTAEMAREADIEVLFLPAAASVPPDPSPAHAAWSDVGWQVDSEQTAAALGALGADAVVVDHYAFDARWHRRVAELGGARVAVIDDLADREIDARLLVDPTLHASHRDKYRARYPDDRLLLGGPRYALLGPAFAGGEPVSIEAGVASIGIFMGGADVADLGGLALRACREHVGFDGPIEIVATSVQPHLEALQALARRWPRTQVRCDLPDLAGFFSRHGLQIGAGGGASWERCCLGVPTLALIGADNQRALLPALAAAGAVATLDDGERVDEAAIGRAVRALLDDPGRRRALGRRGRELVDGLGATRVALALASPALVLRDAASDDAAAVFPWRDDPSTRRFSRNPAALDPGDHRRWWAESLASADRRLFIARIGTRDVGVFRFDLDGTGAEVSLYLDPALTGLGLGRAMLAAAQRCCTTKLGVSRLEGEVLPTNGTSRRMFASAGFEPCGQRWVWESARG